MPEPKTEQGVPEPNEDQGAPKLKEKRPWVRWGSSISIEERKSRVRVWVTKAAAYWVFLGSAVLVAALWIDELDAEKMQAAKDIYMTVLPVATGVITYWFASRGISSKGSKPPPPEEEDGSPQ
ncbi:hypothetical protein [Candidatus Palauibacter soopunensis]|uniref:hypothetical protein n=1 Tax=Candidatus Palauibacter soopunensis TaxID=3056739 RepID=UPI002394B288|nr:hypothetical protein [Candidatus Palauibacter soopunensis]MDE2877891.1 hypothetical protein [Candidatus Palauibacter soopunensis]